MVCVLFNSYFLLCRANNDYRCLQAVACLFVADLKFDTLQNGKGLCCYGCLFSWKAVFQEQGESFELVLSASSASEERAWKTEILKATASLEGAMISSAEYKRYSFSSFNMIPLDRADQQRSLARRTSTRSLGASRGKPSLQHVVIRKTHRPNRLEDPTPVDGEIERLKAPCPHTGVILTARRDDRIRLERFIADVYTRDVLPFPGMVLGKGDILRPGTIMRRLSLRSGFGRRSTSLSIPHRPSEVNEITDKLSGTTDGGQDKGTEEPDYGRGLERKEPLMRTGSTGTTVRTKTLRLRQITRQISRPDFWPTGKEKEITCGGMGASDGKGPILQVIIKALEKRLKRSQSSIGVGG